MVRADASRWWFPVARWCAFGAVFGVIAGVVLGLVERSWGQAAGGFVTPLLAGGAIGLLVSGYWLLWPCQMSYEVVGDEVVARWRRHEVRRVRVHPGSKLELGPPLSWEWSMAAPYAAGYRPLPRLMVWPPLEHQGGIIRSHNLPPIVLWGTTRIGAAEKLVAETLGVPVVRT